MPVYNGLTAKYVISPIDNETYCRKNGQFLRHLRSNGYRSYQDFFDMTYPGSIKYCSCGKLCSFNQNKMQYLRSCGNRKCVGLITSTVKKQFTQSQWANQKQRYRNTMEAKSLDEQQAIIRKRQQTNIEKYGYDHPWKNFDIRKKIATTTKNKYGADNISSTLISDVVMNLLCDATWMYEQHVTLKKPLYIIATELGVGDRTVGIYLHRHNIRTHNYQTPNWERELSNWLTNNEIQFDHNTRDIIGPKELDFFLPTHNIAIELCGLYWHADVHDRISKHYHSNKLKLCAEQNITLLTIFEDEWNSHKQLILNKLLHMCSKNPTNRLYARQTKVVEVSKKDQKQFLDNYHIQQNGNGSVCLGLLSRGELVAVALFKHKSYDAYYLDRYATSIRVVGGLSKLISWFSKQTKWSHIITFADLRWSVGQLYQSVGFELDGILKPDYQYVVNGKRKHKFGYRRVHLSGKLKHYDPNISEWENCKASGILRVWDCGKLRYVKTNGRYTRKQ